MRILFITVLSLIGLCSVKAQEAKFTVEVSADSILMGNYFQVTFSIENGNAKNFEAPNFQGFAIVGGPNQSSSISIVNGVSSQSMSYTYYLEPQEEGLFYIEPANVEIDGLILETLPIAIKVAPNPEGIIQNPSQQKNRTFDSFFDFPSPFGQEFKFPFDQEFQFPSEPKKETKPPKKKRKIYKI